MENKNNIKAYYVNGCKVDRRTIFSGYVLNVDNEPITDSIKRKVGVSKLLCELTNEGFDYNSVQIYTVPLTELSLGDILLITGNYSV